MTDTARDDTAPDARARREQDLTDAVAASFAGATSPRFAHVMQQLVRHLHAFVRDVRPTDAEWHTAIDFLTRTGQLCDDRRQEFVLLSDVLGLSMLTVAVNAVPDPRVTESTVFGPFFVDGSPPVELGGDVARGAVGQPCWVDGTVRGLDGEPVAGARMEVWEADADGFYDVQLGEAIRNRGHLFTGSDGEFRFWSVRPAAYPIPTDGPVGELLRAAGRREMRPAHIHFMVTAPGYRRLTTHVFADGDPWLDDDAVFGVTRQLVVDVVDHGPDDPPPPGGPQGSAWSSVHYDFVLARDVPGKETAR